MRNLEEILLSVLQIMGTLFCVGLSLLLFTLCVKGIIAIIYA